MTYPVGAQVTFTNALWAEDDPLVLREGVVLAPLTSVEGVPVVPVRANAITVLVPPSAILSVGIA